MSVNDYLPLLMDSRTILRTLRQAYGKPKISEKSFYDSGQVQTIINRIHPSRVRARVSGIRTETPSASTLILEAVTGRLPPWQPGQYINIFVEVEGVRTSRPMSISAPNRSGAMELTIKRKEGGFVSGYLLDQVQVGDELLLSGAEGDFYYMPVRDGEDLVLIAAGSGITPFMGMIEQILERFPDVRISLLYGSRSVAEIIFHERLQALAAGHPQLSLRFSLSQWDKNWSGEKGRLDQGMIQRCVEGQSLEAKTFFICGPKEMQQDMQQNLAVLGVRQGKVRVEVSGSTRNATLLPGWPSVVKSDQVFQIRLKGRDTLIRAQAGEPLLNSFERAGISLPALCRSGTCGSCRTKLTLGRVIETERSDRRSAANNKGFIHACVCHPLSDLSVEVTEDYHCPLVDLQSLSADAIISSGKRSQVQPSGDAFPGMIAKFPQRNEQPWPWFKSMLALAGFALFAYLVFSFGLPLA